MQVHKGEASGPGESVAMHTSTRLLTLLALCSALVQPAHASQDTAWVSPLALGPSDATSVAARPGLLLANGRAAGPRVAGLFRSTDGGRSWTLGQERYLDEEGEERLRPIVQTPSFLGAPSTGTTAFAFFGTAVWRSDDHGATWAPVGDTGAAITVFSVLPDGRPVVGLAAGGLRASPDGGATWTPLGQGLPAVRVNEIEAIGPVLLVATDQGLYRSTDGQTFARVTDGIPQPGLTAFGVTSTTVEEAAVARTVVYLAMLGTSAASTAVYMSLDLGASWTAMPIIVGGNGLPRLSPGAFEAVTDTPNQFQARTTALYAASGSGLYLSLVETGAYPVGTAGVGVSAPGLEWLRLEPEPGGRAVPDIAVADRDPGPRHVDAVYAAVTRASVYRAEFHGPDSGFAAPGWYDEPEGGSTCLGMVARPDGSLFASCGRHIVRSNDGGTTWRRADHDLPYTTGLVADALGPLVASADGSLWTSGFADGLYHSNPQVTAWSKVPFPGASVGAVATHPTDPKIVYASGLTTNGCCRTVLQRSTDGGLTWLPVLETGDNIYAIAVSPFDGRKVLVAAFDEGGWRSEDGGATWTKIPELPSSPSSTSDVLFSPAQAGLAYAVGDDDLYRSTDDGRTWEQSGSGGGFPVPSPWDPGTLYVTSPTASVRVTRDAGATWTALAEGLPGGAAGGLAADPTTPGRLYAAAGWLPISGNSWTAYWPYRLTDHV